MGAIMAEIVQSLFGLTPEMYQQQQQDQAGEQALRFAQLTPMQQSNYAIGRGAYGLAGAIGGALGGTDPELQRRTVSQQILGMIDPNRPETFDQAAQMARDAGIPQLAFGLLQESDKYKQQALVRQDEALRRSAGIAASQRAATARELIAKSFQPATPEQQQFVQVDETGQPVAIPARQASFNINPVLPQLMALGTEGRTAITEQASLLPALRKLGTSSMREENPFAVFTTDTTLPKTVQTLATQYSKSFVSGMLDPEKADVRVKELADMTQRVQQFEQNQAQIKANQAALLDLRQQGLENTRQFQLLQQGNQALAQQNAAFNQEMKRAEVGRKEEERKNKPLPAYLAKGEEADYDTAQSATNLAADANNFINRIKTGEIKFGVKEKASIRARQLVGSSAPDVVSREDYDKFLKVLTNESLRLNKGTQTEGDAVRAAKELESSESPQAAAAAMRRLVEINLRRVQDASKSVATRRENANFPSAPRPIDVPVLEYQVIDDADYQRFAKNPKYPSGTIFIDPDGVRRKKP
jgi:hypothetical protein